MGDGRAIDEGFEFAVITYDICLVFGLVTNCRCIPRLWICFCLGIGSDL